MNNITWFIIRSINSIISIFNWIREFNISCRNIIAINIIFCCFSISYMLINICSIINITQSNILGRNSYFTDTVFTFSCASDTLNCITIDVTNELIHRTIINKHIKYVWSKSSSWNSSTFIIKRNITSIINV